jgi:hypothetical protein
MMGYGCTGGDDTDARGWPRVEELLRLVWACCCQNGWEKLPGNQFNKSGVVINTVRERNGPDYGANDTRVFIYIFYR